MRWRSIWAICAHLGSGDLSSSRGGWAGATAKARLDAGRARAAAGGDAGELWAGVVVERDFRRTRAIRLFYIEPSSIGARRRIFTGNKRRMDEVVHRHDPDRMGSAREMLERDDSGQVRSWNISDSKNHLMSDT